MSNSEERYVETVTCEGSAEEGLVFIKVVGMPHESAVEFDLAQARAFADKLQKAIEAVESGWAGGR